MRNKVQLVGHTGTNPEIKVFDNGAKLARISLATNENFKDKNGEWVEFTTWHNLVAWRDIADRLEKQVSKGSKILIEGKLVNRKYQDKDNNTRYTTEVDIRNFMVLDKKSTSTAYDKVDLSNSADDLPF